MSKKTFGRYQVYNYLSGTYYKDLKLESFLRKIINHGAGEIIINLVNNDGKRSGMDLKLIEKLSRLFSIPIMLWEV